MEVGTSKSRPRQDQVHLVVGVYSGFSAARAGKVVGTLLGPGISGNRGLANVAESTPS